VKAATELRTRRLLLRRWRDDDRTAFHALNSDPAVMATIGPVMSRADSDAFMNRIEQRFRE
jgi:RimJ/RimL family protein N-acetyltransferase